MFRPGELDQQITIKEPVEVSDGIGGNTTTYADKGVVFAHVRPLSGREIADFDRVNDEARYMFVVRWPVDIVETDLIDWEGDQFNIRVIKKPKGRDLYCVIEAERGVAL